MKQYHTGMYLQQIVIASYMYLEFKSTVGQLLKALKASM